MIKLTQRKLTIALLALVVIFAGCKAETPTTPTSGGTPSGGITPPTNATLTLTASNTSPVVNSNVTLTATVTQNGQAVANGTAVQFITSFGTFNETGATSVVRTTTNGAATATLTSGTAGTATVTATVNNVTKSLQITFSTQTSTTPPPTGPTISSINPATGKPQGGDTVIISGTNFVAPVRVLFQSGTTVKEAFVCGTCVTPTAITAVTPAFDVAPGAAVTADVIVLTQAGTAGEQRIVKTGAFTFTSAQLTPAITAVDPATGPSTGGTRITITGSGFQAPVQVTMGIGGAAGAPLTAQVELQVISVTFDTIIAMTPEQRLIDPTLTQNNGSVALRVLNVASNKDAVIVGAFRFLPKMAITTVGPTEGPFTGGTRVRIDGIGFDQPAAVVIGGVAAQVISVSGTEIVAITSPVQLQSCGDVNGAISVTNTDNGDSATAGTQFIYRVPKPLITNVQNPASLGGTTQITVLNALGFPRIQIGGVAVSVTGTTVNPDGTTTFTVQVPSNLTLATTACAGGGSAQQTTQFDVVYTSGTTGCTDTAPKGLTVNPPAAPVLFVTPGAFQPFTAKFTAGQAGPPVVPATETPSSPQTLTLVNTGTTALNITAITQTNGAGAGCADFVIVTPPPPTSLNQCESVPVIVTYNGPNPPASGVTDTCTLTFTTNAGNKSFLLVGTSQ